jgi:hypothetical protein
MVAQREIELPRREEAFQAVGQAIQAFSNIELALSLLFGRVSVAGCHIDGHRPATRTGAFGVRAV